MNQRIQELAKQAGYTPIEGFEFANDLNEIFLNKFAKLIIEETLDQVDTWTSCRGECSWYFEDDKRNIREHFGYKKSRKKVK